MNIRIATYHDAPGIKLLLEGLGYLTRTSILIDQIDTMFGKEDHQVFVCEIRKEVLGFVVLHFLPQLGFYSGLVFISYLSVDEREKNKGVAEALEHFIAELARKRKSDRIEVHCMDWRTRDHQFYAGLGYRECPKYFSKRFTYGE